MEEELKVLYALKGELTTQIEIAQAQLRSVNEQIIALINKPAEIGLNGVEKEEQSAVVE